MPKFQKTILTSSQLFIYNRDLAVLSGCSLELKRVWFQVDVDIGSSTVANGVLGLVFGVVTSLVVDMGFLIQVFPCYLNMVTDIALKK